MKLPAVSFYANLIFFRDTARGVSTTKQKDPRHIHAMQILFHLFIEDLYQSKDSVLYLQKNLLFP